MNDRKLTGSGILPIIKKLKKVNLNGLESKDSYQSNSKMNKFTYHVVLYYDKFKKKYEDLGGHIDIKDKDIYNTASRESYEESATYLNIDENILKKCKYVRIKNYICFFVLLNDFNLSKAIKLLNEYKNIKHYNEMGDIKIVNIKEIINKTTSLPLSNRLINIISAIKNKKTNSVG